MTLHGMPGIGGSLGMCAFCGETFIMALIGFEEVAGRGDNMVHTGEVPGIKGKLCFHKPCKEKLAAIAEGTQDWRELPEGGPLYKLFSEAAAEQADEREGDEG